MGWVICKAHAHSIALGMHGRTWPPRDLEADLCWEELGGKKQDRWDSTQELTPTAFRLEGRALGERHTEYQGSTDGHGS